MLCVCRRVCDTVNYGDESDAYGLVNPSMPSSKGVYERDFFEARPRDEVCIYVFTTPRSSTVSVI